MAVNFPPFPVLHPIKGIKLGTALAKIKPTATRDDITLFELAPTSTCAAVFTRNAFCAAPVILARQHLNQTMPRYLLINSGNANAGTGEQGLQDGLASCSALATLGNTEKNKVLPFSTGVIGQPLPVDKLSAALPTAIQALSENGWQNAANAIMTTDTLPKAASLQTTLQGQALTITGIAKGAGMIRPDMATMLAFIATDAKIPATVLQAGLNLAVNQSFNRISVDGDTSTNDACVLVASGQGEVSIDNEQHPHFPLFVQQLTHLCQQLAQAIVRDGEGATKFISIHVEQGATSQECLDVAYTIAHSPLVKTAFFASDANWGRILAAVGRAGLSKLVLEDIVIYLGDVCIVRHGGRATDYTEERGQAVMANSDISIRILLGRGQAQEIVWTCDFSYDYVKINAEYRT
ncbi:bifunctional glutamate N-acetyltransferase/amino-acid acetyltransferase ArgJ [Beggiatoa leptomitoformis]|uniref:Arginine biosynthesis bifunctional protein ArgJ n=1 Tax=Beggiatoa leptomitoformis TaxID=288004 RepID=A0A2N9YCN8_9GAMM|nr:bifunctional glutamate N-acetyltransferase/amino-acid acetyltransferase ArgJ [Beggiatoa leptomitoformis]ALG66481.1 bifunctional glutamate N-acetyltransferase/amino-acid acetyltransferase ArgJ [Beggiatoa leptomitoformis]AUI68228.1 bifunctional glutamate N-acetyltransferase/amino-acid acetyltransferase ArgJ [Beggiatoa leptomitoformis]